MIFIIIILTMIFLVITFDIFLLVTILHQLANKAMARDSSWSPEVEPPLLHLNVQVTEGVKAPGWVGAPLLLHLPHTTGSFSPLLFSSSLLPLLPSIPSPYWWYLFPLLRLGGGCTGPRRRK